MSSARVSILLPNLNNRPYLEERIQTIRYQTFSEWELIIGDSYSDDGAWEYFQNWAKIDSRIKIYQVPRQGIYAGWNDCIRLAGGEYVYIAPGDDTMHPRCLEIMVDILDRYPCCDLAHCKLRIVDKSGKRHPCLCWDKFDSTVYFGNLINRQHIRFAPHDGLLYCGVKSVYTSITQLLIRRRLFDRIGLFLTHFGSVADFEWGMRAALVANTVHIPQYLATWRVHPNQQTHLGSLQSVKHISNLLEMMGHAFETAEKIDPSRLKIIDKTTVKCLYEKERLQFEMKEKKSWTSLFKIGLKWLFIRIKILIKLQLFVAPLEPLVFSRRILARYGFKNNLEITEPPEPA